MTTNLLPAHLQHIPNRNLAATAAANIGAGSPPFVSIMGNRFTLIDAGGAEMSVATFDPKAGPYLDCVIVDVLERLSKIYFGHAFDPSAQSYSPPQCWSDNGVAPSRNAGNPQSPTCASCPQNVWGSEISKVSGKGVKACRDVQKIALLVPGFDMLFLLRIPSNSLKNFRTYTERFKGQKFDMPHILTRMTFQQGILGTLEFNLIGWAPEALGPLIIAAINEKKTDSMVGRTDVPREALPGPTVVQTAAQLSQTQPVVMQTAAQLSQTQPVVVQTAVQPVPFGLTTGTSTQSNGQTEQPQQRRRRKVAEPVPEAQPATAPFMAARPSTGVLPQGGVGTQGVPFGIATDAPAPNAEVTAAIQDIFGAQGRS